MLKNTVEERKLITRLFRTELRFRTDLSSGSTITIVI